MLYISKSNDMVYKYILCIYRYYIYINYIIYIE